MNATYGIRMIVAYDGTAFAGWQCQPEQRTVQGTLQDAVGSMGGKVSVVRGASRTDAGVHALGQCVSFSTTRSIDPKGWKRGLNSRLPSDISIVDATACDPTYDPRRDSTAKTYRYVLRVGETADPLMRHVTWHIGPANARRDRPGGRHELNDWLDVDAMRRAANMLTGTHDYRAFQASNDYRDQTTRTVDWVRIATSEASHEASAVEIEVRGDSFLKNMVRILTGTLVDVGRGFLPVDHVPKLVSPGACRADAGQTAPARGLTLIQVHLGRIAQRLSQEQHHNERMA
ncbi:MAG: tRNA pseudouridine(38-40) synthase TruA [Myxococcota bacterium]